MQLRWLPLLLILLFPMVEAVTYSNRTLSSGSSHTNVTFDVAPVDCDAVEYADTFLTLTGCLVNSSNGTVLASSMNFTVPNTLTDSVSFPRITETSGNTISISNGLNFSVPVSVNASANGIVPSSSRVSHSNGSSETPSSTFDNMSQIVTLAFIIQPGTTTLSLDAAGPAITLTSPTDGAASLGGTVGFTYTPLDNNSIDNCSLLYSGGQVYTTSSSIGNNASNSFVVSGIDGHHVLGAAPLTWSVSCTDEFGNVGTSTTFSVVTATASSGGSGGGGGGGGGSGGAGSGTPAANLTNHTSTNPHSQNTSSNTTIAGNATKVLTLTTPESPDAQSRRNFAFIALGIITMLFIGIAAVSFKRS